MRILFINNNKAQCGVYDYGLRAFNILTKAFDITYIEASVGFEYIPGYDIYLYNYHYATMPFLTDDLLRKFPVKSVIIFHEAHLKISPNEILTTNIRPLIDCELPMIKNNIPTIGSFGFGFPDKNFSKIAEEVASQYETAIIRLNIPFAEFGDKDGYLAKREAEKVRNILKGTKIEVQINHNYLNQTELLDFLNSNDVNLFLYSPSHGRGLASATDYALSVKKPIGVSNSEMFRHLPLEICIDNTPIKELSIEPLKKFYEENTNEKLINYYRQAFNRVLN